VAYSPPARSAVDAVQPAVSYSPPARTAVDAQLGGTGSGNVSRSLQGYSANAYAGNVGLSIDRTKQLAGLSAGTTPGTIWPGRLLVGERATTAQGTPGISISAEVQLTGWLSVMTAGAVTPPTWTVALEGALAVATEGQFFFPPAFVHDTFTDFDSTNLTAHTGELGASWAIASRGSTNNWTIQSGAATPDDSSTYYNAYASGVPPSATYTVSATYVYSGPANRYSNTISEGIVARMSTDGTVGYVFGWGDFDWQLERVGGGVLAETNAYTATGYNGEDVVLSMRVSGTGATVTIKCYVDGVEVLSHDDTAGARVTAAGRAGVHSYNYLNNIGAFADFHAAVDASSSVRLYGARAVTARGTVVGARSVELAGRRAGVTPGVPLATIGVGFAADRAPIPAVVRSTQTHADTNPGRISSAMVAVNGTLYGIAERYDRSFNYWNARRGLLQVSLTAQDTYPWTSYGKGVDGSVDELNTDCLTYRYLDAKLFPRAGGMSMDTYRYNAALSSSYGFISPTPGGDIQTAVVRSYRDEVGAFMVQYLAWQQGDLIDITNNYAAGELTPEFVTGVFRFDSSVWDESLHHRDPLGVLAVTSNEALAFYPRCTNSAAVGACVPLVGHRAEVTPGSEFTVSVEGEGVTLGGLGVTMRAGKVVSAFGPNREAELVGHRTTTSAGVPVPVNSRINTPPAYRRFYNKRWRAETVLSGATGAAQNYAISGSMTVTRSGYGDIVYITYYSAQTMYTDTPSHVALLVMDARSGHVYSHTLSLLTDTPTQFWDVGLSGSARDKPQPEVFTLSNGTSVTQYVQRRRVLHLSWTCTTKTAPVLTVKNGPVTTLTAGWESLEARGDRVYHALYRTPVLYNDPVPLYYNDATGTGSVWVETTVSLSGANWSDGGLTVESHSYLSGSAQGKQTWLYDSRIHFTTGYVYSAATYWQDFWAGQVDLLTVEAKGLVGHVTIYNSTAAARSASLWHARLTTGQGELTPRVWWGAELAGFRLTLTRGVVRNADKTVPLIGRSVTTTPGALFGAINGAVVGYRADLTQGTLTPNKFSSGIRLTGLRATAIIGIARFSGVMLEGWRAISQHGFLAVSVDDNEVLGGLRATGTQGALTATSVVGVSLSGWTATAGQGGVVPGIAIPYWQLRAELVTRIGRLTPSVANDVVLTGRRAIAAQGAFAPKAENSDAATGYRATTAYGVVVPVLAVSLTGARATSRAGGFVPLLAVTPTGERAVSSQGTLQLLLNIALTGRSATCTIGSMTYAYDSTAVISGVYSKGELGDLTQGMWKPEDDAQLWVRTEPEDVEVEPVLENEYVHNR